MTIKPVTNQKTKEPIKKASRKNKKNDVNISVTDERTPLLPKKGGHSDFNGASFTGGVLNLSTTIIGAGIMALPATMKVLGLGLGIASIIFVAFLTEASVNMLLKFGRAGYSDSYGGVMRDAFGNGGKKLLESFVVINNIGVLIVYMIIIGDVLSGTSASGVYHAGVLHGWLGDQWWTGRTFVLLVTTLCVFAPLGCFKRIDSLSYTSALAVGLALVFVIITAGIVVIKGFDGTISMPRWLPDVTDINSVWKLFTVVPVLLTAYICHFNVHPIENELEDSSLIQPVVQTSMVLCSTIYIMTSSFGILLFGDGILDDVLANFDRNLGVPYSYLLNDVVRVSYALHLMLVFPVVFHPVRLNLDNLLFPSAGPLISDNVRFTWITIGLDSIIFMAANFIPSIWDTFQFTGATTVVCIGFIFPASIALRDVHGISSTKDKLLAAFMIGLAVFSSSVAIYSDAYAVFKNNAPTRA